MHIALGRPTSPLGVDVRVLGGSVGARGSPDPIADASAGAALDINCDWTTLKTPAALACFTEFFYIAHGALMDGIVAASTTPCMRMHAHWSYTGRTTPYR